VVNGIDCGRNHLRKDNGSSLLTGEPPGHSTSRPLYPVTTVEMFNSFNNRNNVNPWSRRDLSTLMVSSVKEWAILCRHNWRSSSILTPEKKKMTIQPNVDRDGIDPSPQPFWCTSRGSPLSDQHRLLQRRSSRRLLDAGQAEPFLISNDDPGEARSLIRSIPYVKRDI